MRANYKELVRRYELSGLTMTAFGKQEGMSPGMVSYYVRKSKGFSKPSKASSFAQMEILPSTSENVIKITTSAGTVIEIPA